VQGDAMAYIYLDEQDIRDCFCVSLKEAAKRLGVSMTKLKKTCRNMGVMKWPYRKLNAHNKHVVKSKTDQPIQKSDLVLNDRPRLVLKIVRRPPSTHHKNLNLSLIEKNPQTFRIIQGPHPLETLMLE
jgi:hypothetical protein